MIIGRPGGTRTPNIRFWRPALYQFELLACRSKEIYVLPKSIACRFKAGFVIHPFWRDMWAARLLFAYLVSRCTVCCLQVGQNFLSSSLAVVFFLFLVVE
jgi:hypothetical protein